MKRRVISTLIAVSMIVASLTACGSAASTATDTAPETAAPAEEQAAEPAAAEPAAEAPAAEETASDAPVTLKWALWDKDATVYYQPLIDGYTAAHPNVTIEMVDLGSTDYQTVLGTQLSGSDADFDVVTIKDVPGLVTLANKGVLEPLDSLISQDGLDLSVYSGITDQVKVNDVLYELPFRRDIWVLFYNKDVFDKAGVAYPTNDMTWKEYDELARKITDTTPGSEVYGAHYHTWRSTIQLMGILDGKHTIVDGTYEFTKPYYDMVLAQQKDGVCMDYATLKTQGLHYSAAFYQGNIGMMNMGSWFIPTLIEKIKDGEGAAAANWGIVKYPHAEGVEPGSTLATITALAIPTSAPNKDVAWDFVKFCTLNEETADWWIETSQGDTVSLISALDKHQNDENSIYGGEKLYSFWLEQAKGIDYSKVTKYDKVIGDAWGAAIGAIKTGQATREDALNTFYDTVASTYPEIKIER